MTAEQRCKAAARILATGAIRAAAKIDREKRKIDTDEDKYAESLGSQDLEGAELTG